MGKSIEKLADVYRAFADREARGISPSYERYALSIAENTELLGRLLDLPNGKQQPSLLLGTTRHAVGLPAEGLDFAQHALEAWDDMLPIILTRSTQTNEPARCACLLPALGKINEPIAIIEVGASAGLCLIPDQYGYDYGRTVLPPMEDDAPVFPCKASEQTPIPSSHTQIVWRAGLDLNPLDVCNDEDMQWLKTFVWPEQTERRSRLEAAIAVARRDPPNIIAGDLIKETEALAAQAPTDAWLLIFHSAVMGYVSAQVRKEFSELVRDLGAEWLANETPRVLPDVASADMLEDRSGVFVLSHNGRAIARTGPHGQFVDWL